MSRRSQGAEFRKGLHIIGTGGGRQFDTVMGPQKKITPSMEAYAKRFNKGVIE